MVRIKVKNLRRTASRGRGRNETVVIETPEAIASSPAADDSDGHGAGASSAPGAEEAEGQDASIPEVDDATEIRLGDQPGIDPGDPDVLAADGRRKGRRGWNLGQGRAKRGRPPEAAPAEKAPAKGLDRQAVAMLLQMVDAMTTSSMGPEAAFSAKERGLIEPSLARILARMSPSSAKVFGTMADPILLGTGLFIWAQRVMAIQRQNRPPQSQPVRREPIRPDFQRQPTAPTPAPEPHPSTMPSMDAYGNVSADSGLADAWGGSHIG